MGMYQRDVEKNANVDQTTDSTRLDEIDET